MSKVHYANWQYRVICGRSGTKTIQPDLVTCLHCLKKLPKAVALDKQHAANWANAIFTHPITGEKAKPGRAWVRSIFGDWCQESPDTPWTSSVQSETYWSS